MEEILKDNWVWILIAALWSLPWKAVALWKSARRGEKGWFIVFVIVNTLALIEIWYIFFHRKRDGYDGRGA